MEAWTQNTIVLPYDSVSSVAANIFNKQLIL